MTRPWCLWYFMSHWKWFRPLQVQENCQDLTCPRVVIWSLHIAYFYFKLSGILLMRNPGLRRRNSWLAPMITDVILPVSRTFVRSINVLSLSLQATNQPFRFDVLFSVNFEFYLKMSFPWCYNTKWSIQRRCLQNQTLDVEKRSIWLFLTTASKSKWSQRELYNCFSGGSTPVSLNWMVL
jgi:hypothetical protein